MPDFSEYGMLGGGLGGGFEQHGMLGGSTPLQRAYDFPNNGVAPEGGWQNDDNNPLFNLLRFSSRPIYAVTAALAGDFGGAGKNLLQGSLDFPFGMFDKRLSFSNALPDSVLGGYADLTSRSEQREVTDLLRDWGGPDLDGLSGLTVDILGGAVLDPLTYFTGVGGVVRSAITGMTRKAAAKTILRESGRRSAGLAAQKNAYRSVIKKSMDGLYGPVPSFEQALQQMPEEIAEEMAKLATSGKASLGGRSGPLAQDLLDDSFQFGQEIERGPINERIIDALQERGILPGSGIKAGLPDGIANMLGISKKARSREFNVNGWKRILRPDGAYEAFTMGMDKVDELAKANLAKGEVTAPSVFAAAGLASAREFVTSKLLDKRMSTKLAAGIEQSTTARYIERGSYIEQSRKRRELWGDMTDESATELGKRHAAMDDAFYERDLYNSTSMTELEIADEADKAFAEFRRKAEVEIPEFSTPEGLAVFNRQLGGFTDSMKQIAKALYDMRIIDSVRNLYFPQRALPTLAAFIKKAPLDKEVAHALRDAFTKRRKLNQREFTAYLESEAKRLNLRVEEGVQSFHMGDMQFDREMAHSWTVFGQGMAGDLQKVYGYGSLSKMKPAVSPASDAWEFQLRDNPIRRARAESAIDDLLKNSALVTQKTAERSALDLQSKGGARKPDPFPHGRPQRTPSLPPSLPPMGSMPRSAYATELARLRNGGFDMSLHKRALQSSKDAAEVVRLRTQQLGRLRGELDTATEAAAVATGRPDLFSVSEVKFFDDLDPIRLEGAQANLERVRLGLRAFPAGSIEAAAAQLADDDLFAYAAAILDRRKYTGALGHGIEGLDQTRKHLWVRAVAHGQTPGHVNDAGLRVRDRLAAGLQGPGLPYSGRGPNVNDTAKSLARRVGNTGQTTLALKDPTRTHTRKFFSEAELDVYLHDLSDSDRARKLIEMDDAGRFDTPQDNYTASPGRTFQHLARQAREVDSALRGSGDDALGDLKRRVGEADSLLNEASEALRLAPDQEALALDAIRIANQAYPLSPAEKTLRAQLKTAFGDGPLGTVKVGEDELDVAMALVREYATRRGLSPEDFIDQNIKGVIFGEGENLGRKLTGKQKKSIRQGRIGSVTHFGKRTKDFVFGKNFDKKALSDDSKAVIRGLETSSPLSMFKELGRVFLRDAVEAGEIRMERLGQLADDASGGDAMLSGKWTPEHQEWFADQFASYVAKGDTSVPELRNVFDRFRDWLSRVWASMSRSATVEVSPEVRKHLDDMFGSHQRPPETMRKEKFARRESEFEAFSNSQQRRIDQARQVQALDAELAQIRVEGTSIQNSYRLAAFELEENVRLMEKAELEALEFAKKGDLPWTKRAQQPPPRDEFHRRVHADYNQHVYDYLDRHVSPLPDRKGIFKLLGGGYTLHPQNATMSAQQKADIVQTSATNGIHKAAWVLRNEGPLPGGNLYRKSTGLNYFFRQALTSNPHNVAHHVGNNTSSAVQGSLHPDIGIGQGLKSFLNVFRDVPWLQQLSPRLKESEARIWIKAARGDPDAIKSLDGLNAKVGEFDAADVAEHVRGMLSSGVNQSDIMRARDKLERVSKGHGSYQFKEGFEAYNAYGEKVGAWVEGTHRVAALLKLARTGKYTLPEAVQEVDRVYVSYLINSEVERNIRDAFLFSRFAIGSARWGKEMMRRPGSLLTGGAGMRDMAAIASSSASSEEELPTGIKGTLAIPMGQDAEGNDRYITSLRLPQESAMKLLNFNTWGGMKREGLSTLAPPLRFGIEQFTDTSLRFGGPAGGTKRAPKILGLLGIDGTVPGLVNDMVGAAPFARFNSQVNTLFDERDTLSSRLTELTTGFRTRRVASANALIRKAEKLLTEAGIDPTKLPSRKDAKFLPDDVRKSVNNLTRLRRTAANAEKSTRNEIKFGPAAEPKKKKRKRSRYGQSQR